MKAVSIVIGLFGLYLIGSGVVVTLQKVNWDSSDYLLNGTAAIFLAQLINGWLSSGKNSSVESSVSGSDKV